ncbi:nucleotide disphospho-sugar-binding domain-containing protein [Streptomyces sp. NPDC020801]|uniref:nucleotide disphospho-sugar-binding domain-containing protein n=1 Tax=unclassified Streptomyces TaxID=2593676 RepID=UPI003798EED5
MRALFVPSPGLSHHFPTVPLAHALLAAGHEVRYATGGDVHAVSEAGLCGVDVTPGVDYAKVFIPQDSEVSDPMHADDLGSDFLARMFARVSAVAVDGVLDVARSWSPDLVVTTPTQGAGPLTAAALGVPCVELPLGPADGEPALARQVRDAMTAAYERHGITGEPATSVRISPIPPSIDRLLFGDGRPGDDWPMRYVPYNGGAIVPEWICRPAERARIAVTLGAIDAKWGGIARLAPLLSQAGGLDAEFVLTLGGGDVSLLGELPANVRVVEWVPLAVLLETCSGIIHHGGTGTMMTALALGVPQCALPQGSFQNIACDALTLRGIGFAADGADAASCGQACRRLLEDQELRKAALGVRDELLSMPAAADLVPRLVKLVG